MRWLKAFISKFPPIGRKETGNEQETKRGFLCKTGNGHCFHPIRAYAQSPPSQTRRRSPRANTQQETMYERVMS